jgi:dienelactone hydrolase
MLREKRIEHGAAKRQSRLDCGGKRSATPLSGWRFVVENGVAAGALPPRSKSLSFRCNVKRWKDALGRESEAMKASGVTTALIGLLVFAGAGCGDQQRQPSSSPTGSIAETFVDRLARHDFAGAVAPFDDAMKQAMPEATMRETWQTLVKQAGPFKQKLGTRTMQQVGFDIAFVTCEFERAILDIKVVFNRENKISGLWFVPGKRPDPDAEPVVAPKTIRETEIKVGDGEWALPGTLTTPAAGTGPWPAVVLVHGSGPQDRDETVGMNKPFRDLAWGLAAKGVAVLRYEKATKAFPKRFLAMRGMTVKEETLDDAIQAVERLRKTSGIDPNRIFVAGHSLGGMVAPRIGMADSKIAGLIILAGSTRPLEEIIVQQTRYLLSLDGDFSSADQKRFMEVESEMNKVRNLTSADSNATALIFGAPPSYWLDLRQYDAAAAAAKLKQRILILQGERDYQATVADFDGWKKQLSSRPNVTFKLYPKLNHLFMAGEGKSSPAEYDQPGRVADALINDIADWILRR